MARSAFANLIIQYNAWRGAEATNVHTDTDDLPPLDILISFVTPQGNFASVFLRAVTFLDESLNLSVRDSNLTEVYSWMAASCTNVLDSEVDKLVAGKVAAATPAINWMRSINEKFPELDINEVKGPPS